MPSARERLLHATMKQLLQHHQVGHQEQHLHYQQDHHQHQTVKQLIVKLQSRRRWFAIIPTGHTTEMEMENILLRTLILQSALILFIHL